VGYGIDMFDCGMLTRNARNGYLFTSQDGVKIKNAVHRHDESPLDADCSFHVCQTYTRSYLHHLHRGGGILATRLHSWHNLHYYLNLMRRMRSAIEADAFTDFQRRFFASPEGMGSAQGRYLFGD